MLYHNIFQKSLSASVLSIIAAILSFIILLVISVQINKILISIKRRKRNSKSINRKVRRRRYFEHNSKIISVSLCPNDKEVAVSTLNGELFEVYGTISGGGRPKRGGMSNKQRNMVANEEDYKKLNELYEKSAKEYEVIKIELNR